jgi:hypothetical protein
MNTFGNDDMGAAPQSLRAASEREERQPTVGELVQIVKDLLPEKWKQRGFVPNTVVQIQNAAIQRDMMKGIFEEAVYIWMIADKVCYRHKTFRDVQADRAEATKSWDVLNQFGTYKIKAKEVHNLLGWTEKQFLSAWKSFVKKPFDPEAMLSNVFVESVRANREHAYNRKDRARKERYRGKKGAQGKK